jgi:hypothetical protein
MKADRRPCPITGLWKVKPEYVPSTDLNGCCQKPLLQVVHLDTFVHSAHLIGAPGTYTIPRSLTHFDSLDAFNMFFVNKYIDYNTFEIAY